MYKNSGCIFLLLFSLSLSAQNDLYLSFFGTFQRTSIYNKLERSSDFLQYHEFISSGLEYKFKPTYGGGMGIYLRKKLKNRFDIGSGALYCSHQQKYYFYSASVDYISNGRIRLEYLKVPLFVSYNFIQKERFKMFLAAGPQISMLLSEDGGLVEFQPTFKWVAFLYTGSKYREFCLDGIAFMGAEIFLRKDLFFFSQFRFDYGFTDAEDKKAVEMYSKTTMFEVFSYDYYKRPITHNIAYGLSLGLTYSIERKRVSEKTSDESYF